MKRLKKHGNSRAIVVNKAFLKAAGITDNALFSDLSEAKRRFSHPVCRRE